MSNRASVIAEAFAEREPYLEREVFATVQPEAIAQAVDSFCRAHLGAGIVEYEFFATSVGSVHGVRLTDGRRVVVKVHRTDSARDHLLAVQCVQKYLSGGQFPSPRPLLGPTPLVHGLAVVETLLDEGWWADAHQPAVRREMAFTLARLVEVSRPLASLPGLSSMRDRARQLWLHPHDPRFDFPGTSHGAEWIDRLARAANEQVDNLAGGADVVGHSDYRVEHLLFTEGRVTAVYDWDSLGVGPESIVVASAAQAFTADWSKEGYRCVPTLKESTAFIADYEAARGASFAPAERQATSAAMVAALAYGARCEHSDRLTDWGDRLPGPAPAAVPPDGCLALLATHGAHMLGSAANAPGAAL